MIAARQILRPAPRRPSFWNASPRYAVATADGGARSFGSSGVPAVPRIAERRPDETGRGGRASDGGVKVCVFGATGFLGRYVASGLGECHATEGFEIEKGGGGINFFSCLIVTQAYMLPD